MRKFEKNLVQPPSELGLIVRAVILRCLAHFEKFISEDMDTLLTGPPGKRQATPEDARRPPVEAGEQEGGIFLPKGFYKRRPIVRCPAVPIRPKNSLWQAVSQ